MKGTRTRKEKGTRIAGTMVLALICMAGLMMILPPMEAYAYTQQQAKVTSATANIRADADTSSQALASVKSGDSLTVTDEKTGTDGKVWFEVFVNSNQKGYIRSDLIDAKVTGAGSSTGSAGTGGGTITPAIDNTTGEVIPVEPQSASVTGEQVRVRAGSSTSSSIVTTVQKDVVLTITGQTTGSDGKTWYQALFVSEGTETTGYVRSDFVSLSGEVVPKTDNPDAGEAGDAGGDEPAVPDEPEPPAAKDYETELIDGSWYLQNNIDSKRYKIDDLFKVSAENAAALAKSLDKEGKQTVIIVILAILLAVAVLGITLLIFKLKDMTEDGFDFGAKKPERKRPEEQRRPAGPRTAADRPTGGTSQRPAGSNAQRPAGQRPAGSSASGQRPGGSGVQGQRPMGNGQSQRPAGADGQGMPRQRPTGGGTGQRPAGSQAQRPAGSPAQGQRMPDSQGPKPVRNQPQKLRTDAVSPSFDMTEEQDEEKITRQTSQRLEEQRIQRQSVSGSGEAPQRRKSKNFLAEDEEFEFEFLNWDGEEDK